MPYLMGNTKEVEDEAWLCVVDFNEVLVDFDVSQAKRRASDMTQFGETLEEYELCDLRFHGELLTWDNNLEWEDNVQSRLDRAYQSGVENSLYG